MKGKRKKEVEMENDGCVIGTRDKSQEMENGGPGNERDNDKRIASSR